MNFGKLLVGNVLIRTSNICVNMLMVLLFTRLLGVEGYGRFSLLIANISLFSLITCLGSESAITYGYSSGKIRKGKLYSIVYLVVFFQVFLLLITEIIHFSLTHKYWLLDGNETELLIWGLVYLLTMSIIDKYTAIFNGAHLYTLHSKVILASNFLILLGFGFVYFFAPVFDTLIYLKLFIAGFVMQAIFLLFVFHGYLKNQLIFELLRDNDRKFFFFYSFIVFVTNVIQFIAYRADYWIIDYYYGKEELGLYSLATKIGQMFWLLPAMFSSIIFPISADRDNAVGDDKLFALMRIANTFLILGGIIAILVAKWLIPFFAGQDFILSVTPFVYLVPGIVLFCINIMLAGYFAGKGKLYINLAGSVICLVVALLLDIWLIPIYGIIGAAIASSIAYSISGLFHLWRISEFKETANTSVIIIQRKDWKLIQSYLKTFLQ